MQKAYLNDLDNVLRVVETLKALGERVPEVKSDKNWRRAFNDVESVEVESLSIDPEKIISTNTDAIFKAQAETAVLIEALPSGFTASDIFDLLGLEGFDGILSCATKPVTLEIYQTAKSYEAGYLSSLLLEMSETQFIEASEITFFSRVNDFLSLNKSINQIQVLHGLAEAFNSLTEENAASSARRLVILTLLMSNGNGHLILDCLNRIDEGTVGAGYIYALSDSLLRNVETDCRGVDADVILNIWVSLFERPNSVSPEFLKLIQFMPDLVSEDERCQFSKGASHLLCDVSKFNLANHAYLFDGLFAKELSSVHISVQVLANLVDYAVYKKSTSDLLKIFDRAQHQTWPAGTFAKLVSYFRLNPEGYMFVRTNLDFFVRHVNVHPLMSSSVIEMFATNGCRDEVLDLIDQSLATPVNVSMLKNAVKLRALSPSAQKQYPKNAQKRLILTDVSASSSAFKKIIQADDIHIYNPFPMSTIDIDGNLGVKVFDSGTFNDKQEYIRQLAAASEKIASEITQAFVKTATSSELSKVLNILHDALFATIRVHLIALCRHHEMYRYWMEICDDDYDDVTIIASGSEFAKEMAQIVLNSKYAETSQMLCLPSSLKDMPLYFDAFDPHSKVYNEYANAPTQVQEDELKTVFDAIYDSVTPLFQASESESAGIFVVRLASKTVSGAIVPVIQESIKAQSNYILEIQTSKDVSADYDFPSGPSQETASDSVPHIISLQLKTQAKKLARTQPDVMNNWFNANVNLVKESISKNLGSEYIDTILKAGIGFNLTNFAYLVALYKNFETVMDSAKEFQVVVCPGRSVEAYLAQSMAHAKGQISMDVMNAWMSDKSTYATPRGDIVTAIDFWSKELLRDHFFIQEKSIKQLGTPRYDGIYQRAAKEDIPALRAKFGLAEQVPTVCFATQPIDMDLNLEILDSIVLANARGLYFDTIIKLHPREDEGRVAQYIDFIKTLPVAVQSSIKLFQKENIIDTLLCSDLVVTVFSNAATEASLCRKPTILCKFGDVAAPIPLDEMHLGRPAHSAAELTEFVARALSEPDEMKKYHALINKFLRLNSQLKTDNTSKNIFKALQSKDLIGMGSQRPLAPSLK